MGLFVTCLVDLYRPSVGFAAIQLLQAAGCWVEINRLQTCCGQPAYNSGDRATARDLAEGILMAFRGYDYVVAPSGSCAGMIRSHFPGLFEDDPNLRALADEVAARTYELTSFLTDVMGYRPERGAVRAGTFTYHDGCSGLRELGVKAQPRALLDAVGVAVTEMAEPEICCGFGGTFCVKYPEISGRMVTDKVRDIAATKADTVLAGDLGCLLNIAGRLSREGVKVDARHVAEVLIEDGMTVPPIGGKA